MLLERVWNDPGAQVTSGKLQATPLGGIPPPDIRRSTGRTSGESSRDRSPEAPVQNVQAHQVLTGNVR